MSVEKLLQKFYKAEDASEILQNSTLVNHLKEDPCFVYHFDESYWAQQVRLEHETGQKQNNG